MVALRVMACPLAMLCAVACSFPTGSHGGHHGGNCNQTTFLNDDFSTGSLANWFTFLGQPTISSSVGDPPPAVLMSNAAMQSNASFRTSASCGLTLSTAVRIDTGFALIKLVVPGVQRVALVQAFDTLVVYVLCQPNGCIHQAQLVAADTAWHTYQYAAVLDSATTRWMRDGIVQFSVGGAVATYDSLRLNLGVFPTDSAGTGPSRGYFDNVLVTSP
jgi:hypothetical protein